MRVQERARGNAPYFDRAGSKGPLAPSIRSAYPAQAAYFGALRPPEPAAADVTAAAAFLLLFSCERAGKRPKCRMSASSLYTTHPSLRWRVLVQTRVVVVGLFPPTQQPSSQARSITSSPPTQRVPPCAWPWPWIDMARPKANAGGGADKQAMMTLAHAAAVRAGLGSRRGAQSTRIDRSIHPSNPQPNSDKEKECQRSKASRRRLSGTNLPAAQAGSKEQGRGASQRGHDDILRRRRPRRPSSSLSPSELV